MSAQHGVLSQPFIELNQDNFQTIVETIQQPLIIEIVAEWSGSCHIMEPVIRLLADEYQNRLVFACLDIETNEDLAQSYGVTELPMILMFRNGKLVDHSIGTVSRKILIQKIEQLLSN